MTSFIALLRAVNLGAASTLPMQDLRGLCERLGYGAVRTYIASGNVVFSADHTEAQAKAALEKALLDYAGKPIGVVIRTADEMAAALAANPFPQAAPNRTVALFLDAPPPTDWQAKITGRRDEDFAAGRREIYVHYPSGIGTSKLRIPAASTGTGRNMNTVAKLAAMAAG